jgi:hypothetical protein
MGGKCVAGTDQGTCGNNGGVCADCAAQNMQGKSGSVCVPTMGGGQCGCNGNGDCPMNSSGCFNKACDFTCSAKQACLVGCCLVPQGQMVGNCVAGTANNLCGTSVLCADCSANDSGHVCVPGMSNKCGCQAAGDCPMGTACNTATKACENVCGDMSHTNCNGGCCSAGMCVAGTAPAGCGVGGVACVDCTANAKGHACIIANNMAACGCNAAADCPANTACNTMTHACEATCGDMNHSICNGGCCNIPKGMMTGTCVAGSQNGACGTDGKACAACSGGLPTCTAGACAADCGKVGNGTCGAGNCCNTSTNKCVSGDQPTTCGFQGTCVSCAAAANGHACYTGNKNGPWFCGCADQTDCSAADPANGIGGQACDKNAHTCTTTCNVNNVTICNGGCCAAGGFGGSRCGAGAALAACGNMGGLCSNCNNCAQGQQGQCLDGACTCCRGTGTNCGQNADCCSGTCTAGRCACVALGGACNGNGNICCNAGFFGATCGGNGKCCLGQFAQCQNNGQCCSGTCGNFGRCN